MACTSLEPQPATSTAAICLTQHFLREPRTPRSPPAQSPQRADTYDTRQLLGFTFADPARVTQA